MFKLNLIVAMGSNPTQRMLSQLPDSMMQYNTGNL